jgi:S-DNA-T family DNA segregation ATPase FtsK/SpoIIIE
MRGIEALYAKRDSIFGQFPVRIALPGGADVLDVRNASAAALRLGTAVVNTAGGLGGPSGASRAHERVIDFPDPHAEPKTPAELRRRLWQARPAGSEPPYIFEGYAAAHLPDVLPTTRRPTAYLGRYIDVPQTLATFPLDATPGRHLAVVGPGDAGAELLDAATRSLARQHAPGTVRFVLAPLVAAADGIGAELHAALASAGHDVAVVDAAGLRTAVADGTAVDTYLIGFGVDGLGTDLRPLLREGPARHTHLLGWWRGLRRFGEDTGGLGGRDDVAGLVLLGVSGSDAAVFLGEIDLDWRPRPNRALLHDRHTTRTEVIVPFSREVAT